MLQEKLMDFLLDEVKTDEVFYKTKHRYIYSAMKNLYKSSSGSSNVDILTVVEQLTKMGKLEDAGGAFYISTLTGKVSGVSNFEYHLKILKEKYMSRRLIEICQKAQTESYKQEKDIFDLLSETESSISTTFSSQVTKDTRIIESAFKDALIDLKTKIKDRREGVNSEVIYCLSEIDRITGGLHRGDLTIIAARPGMGKTAFALTLAKNVAIKLNRAAAFFTLEVTEAQIVSRLMSMESGVELSLIRDARLNDEHIEKIQSMSKLIESNLFIDDSAGLTVQELRSKCRRLKNKYNIELIVVDYLQLLRADFEKGRRYNRDQEIGEISRTLKSLAKELSVPVVALSQLSRAVESRNDKRPMLSDLRESGNLEQDADNVAFLYRPEYYGIEMNEEGDSTEGLVEFIMAKHRHGQNGSVNLSFQAKFTRFDNYENIGEVGRIERYIKESTSSNGGYNESMNPNSSFDDKIPF